MALGDEVSEAELKWLDRWLIEHRGLKSKIDEPDVEQRVAPCLPNRFLALVPCGRDGSAAVDVAATCREGAKRAWLQIADAVWRELDPRLRGIDAGWAKRWAEQVENFFEVRTAVLPWRECPSDALIAQLIAGTNDFDKAFPDAAQVRGLARAFLAKASDRWAYHLRAEVDTLKALDNAAVQAEIRRQVGRAEEFTRRLFGETNEETAGQRLVAAFDAYRTAQRPPERDGEPGQPRFASDGDALSQFITLASFLARGRDE